MATGVAGEESCTPCMPVTLIQKNCTRLAKEKKYEKNS